MQAGDHRKDCCSREENLGPEERYNPEVTYRRCIICNCRHFEAIAEPGNYNFSGKPIG